MSKKDDLKKEEIQNYFPKINVSSPDEKKEELVPQSSNYQQRLGRADADSRAFVSTSSKFNPSDFLINSGNKDILRSASSSTRNAQIRHNYSDDIGKIESTLFRLSRSKMASVDLLSIDKSIKSTFKMIGKAPPEYEGLTELQLRENLEKQIEELKRESQTLKSENNILMKKLDNALNSPQDEFEEKLQKNEKEIANLKESNKKLEDDLEIAKLEIEKNAEIKKSLNVEQDPKYQALVNENYQIKIKVNELELELSQNKPSNINKIESSDLKSKLKELQNQNHTLSKTLQELNQKNLTLSNKVGELEEMQNSTINAIKIEEPNKSIRGGLQKTETVYNPNFKKDISDYDPNSESPFRKFLFEPSIPIGGVLGTGSLGASLGILGGSLGSYNGQELFGHTGISSIGTANGDNRYEYANNNRNSTQKPLKKSNAFSPSMPKAVTYEDIVGKDDYLNNGLSNNRIDEFSLGNLVSAYKSNIPKEVKGTLVDPENSVLYNMLDAMTFGDGINKLAYFKMSCLKTKSPIYENHLVQIGASTTVVRDQSTQRNHLKIALYYGNKTNDNITHFTTQINASDLFQIFTKPEKLDGTIAPQKQLKQQIIVNFLKFPFPCVRLDCGVATFKDLSTFNIYLPTTINKFMEFKFIDANEFKKKWKQDDDLNILKTTELQLDGTIAKNVHDLKNYFNYIIPLTPTNEYDFIHGKKSIKLAGCFELDQPGVEYLLKFIVLSNQNVVIQLACPNEYTELGAFVLQTLSFLFRA